MWPLWVKPLMRSTPRHQFLVQMPKAKVSWLLCIKRLVSKTDNVIHFARLVKQACVDLVSDLFVYYRLGCEPFVCSWGLHGGSIQCWSALSVSEATVWNHLICWVLQTLPCWSNSDCPVRGSSPIGHHVTAVSKPLMQSTPRHQFLVQMLKAKVSWLLCIERLVSKTDNVIHFACLVKQVCVDLVSDLFVYYRLGCEPFVCSWGWHIQHFAYKEFCTI